MRYAILLLLASAAWGQVDVPAVQVPIESTWGWMGGDIFGCSNGGKPAKELIQFDMNTQCIKGHREGCADKSRILLTSEDGKKHCVKFTEPPNIYDAWPIVACGQFGPYRPTSDNPCGTKKPDTVANSLPCPAGAVCNPKWVEPPRTAKAPISPKPWPKPYHSVCPDGTLNCELTPVPRTAKVDPCMPIAMQGGITYPSIQCVRGTAKAAGTASTCVGADYKPITCPPEPMSDKQLGEWIERHCVVAPNGTGKLHCLGAQP